MVQTRKKNRLEKFLYKEGHFFVTINVHHHICIFGEIIDEEMRINQYGKIIEECWFDLPNHYGNCQLADFVIMPNHIHAIISIEKMNEKFVRNGFKPFPTTKHGLSEIVRGFKTFSSRKIHVAGLSSFKRQKSFYDHVIRNEQDLLRIKEYILLNPYKRKNDEHYK